MKVPRSYFADQSSDSTSACFITRSTASCALSGGYLWLVRMCRTLTTMAARTLSRLDQSTVALALSLRAELVVLCCFCSLKRAVTRSGRGGAGQKTAPGREQHLQRKKTNQPTMSAALQVGWPRKVLRGWGYLCVSTWV